MLVRTIRWSCMLWLVTLGACEELLEIGSQCHNGLCEVNPVPSGPACLVTTQARRLRSNLEDGAFSCDEPRFDRDASGLAPCELFWSADDPLVTPPVLENCSGFLTPAEPELAGGARCRVSQLPISENGIPDASAEGFYYLEQAPGDSPECADGMRPGAFRYTSGIQLPEGVHQEIVCTTTQTSGQGGALTSIDPSQCAGAEAATVPSEIVGAPCSPLLQPEAGYDQASASIETGNRDCGAAQCMVYHVAGAVSGECVDLPTASDPTPQCARHVEAFVYCSCRCDVPAGQSDPECTCPNDFSCTPLIAQGRFAGSYCARSNTVNEP